MRLEIDIPEHQYNNIMAIDSISLGRAPYKGIVMYAINAIKRGKVLEQEPKFIAKSDGTIEQIKNCNDCLFKKEWDKIGKLLSVVLKKQTGQEPKTGHWIVHPKGIYAHLICDKCLSSAPYDCITNYCPNCGADMRGEEET